MPAFVWTEKDVALVGDAPFNTGFILTGHDFWIEGKKKVQEIYKHFAYAFTKLGFRNPVLLVLAVACVQYCTALAKCIGRSWAILKLEKKPEKKDAPAPANG
jgi:predicted phosphohydrolase